MMCRRCGQAPATLNVVGETDQGVDYCMECWLRGSYRLEDLLQKQPAQTIKQPVPLISSAVWRLVGSILIAMAFFAAYCWVCGAERFASQGEAPAPLHWVWILALAALGRLLQLVGQGEGHDVQNSHDIAEERND